MSHRQLEIGRPPAPLDELFFVQMHPFGTRKAGVRALFFGPLDPLVERFLQPLSTSSEQSLQGLLAKLNLSEICQTLKSIASNVHFRLPACLRRSFMPLSHELGGSECATQPSRNIAPVAHCLFRNDDQIVMIDQEQQIAIAGQLHLMRIHHPNAVLRPQIAVQLLAIHDLRDPVDDAFSLLSAELNLGSVWNSIPGNR
jgi:hypothetical protein